MPDYIYSNRKISRYCMTNVGSEPPHNHRCKKQTYSNMYEEKPWQKYHIGKYIIESQNDMKYEMIRENTLQDN